MARGEPLVRQWNLIKALQHNRFGTSLDELAKRTGCGRRTVQRDLQVLQEAGFPIRFEERDFGKRFWTISRDFIEREELMLSITEVLSLFLGRQLLAPLAGTQFGDGLTTAMEKIKALLPARALNYFDELDENLLVKPMARQDHTGHDKEIRILNKALSDGRVLKVRYRSANQGRVIETMFHPYGLVFFGASLYCIGHLEEYGEIRTLKVTRFKGIEQTGKLFQRPASFSLHAYTHGTFGVFSPGKYRTIKVQFTGWAATNVREHQWHPSQKILKDVGSQLTASFELSDTTEFKRWLLGFGRRAVVKAPKGFAQEVAEELAGAAAAYVRGRPASKAGGTRSERESGRV